MEKEKADHFRSAYSIIAGMLQPYSNFKSSFLGIKCPPKFNWSLFNVLFKILYEIRGFLKS